MSAPKHSPAPWWHDKDACAIRYRLPAGHPDRYSDDPELDDGARNVVSLIGACGGTDTAADVALMTAAPELLAALHGLYELCAFGASPDAFRNGVTDSTGMMDEGDVRASDRLCAARAAIAKAEGRA